MPASDSLCEFIDFVNRHHIRPRLRLFDNGEHLEIITSRTDLLLTDQSDGRAQFQMQVPPYFSRNTLRYGAETYVELRSADAD
jgi:uncharacterized protein